MKLGFENFKNKKIHIIGISGLEGWAMLDFFLTLGIENIIAHDFTRESDLKQNFVKNHPGFSKKEIKKSLLKISNYKKRIKIFFKERYLRQINEADFIFVPQSWFLYKENQPLLKLEKKTPFLGIMNIYFAFTPSKIIGITGSQGKTTTSRLVYHIFQGIKENTYYGGNDKKAAQCLLEMSKMKKNDFLILEVSHRHLKFLKSRGKNLDIFKENLKTPYIAVILNINKNHLDEVKNFEEYKKIKKRILLFQGERDAAVLNYDDPVVRSFYKDAKGKVIFFSKKRKLKEGAFLDLKDDFLKLRTKTKEIKIVRRKTLSLQARHHLENILAAIAVGFLSKIKLKIIKREIETFSWPQNCFEYLGSFKGVKYYNNLASTTPETTQAAIETLVLNGNNKSRDQKLILITGGKDKEMDYRNLIRTIKKRVKILFLFPDNVSRKIKHLSGLKGRKLIKKVKNLKEALNIIKEEANRGDTVLLSPSGAFFQSRYGRRRGFLKIVKSL